jgi:frataxin
MKTSSCCSRHGGLGTFKASGHLLSFHGHQQARDAGTIAAPPGEYIADISEARFHELADDTLDEIIDLMSVIEEYDGLSADADSDDVDLNYSQGVLSAHLGLKGIWVMNKQTPNRQIWWSSPISGPKRFELTPHALTAIGEDTMVSAKNWTCTRDGESGITLQSLLRSEMLEISGLDILN